MTDFREGRSTPCIGGEGNQEDFSEERHFTVPFGGTCPSVGPELILMT
jgi:hypothetical protein